MDTSLHYPLHTRELVSPVIRLPETRTPHSASVQPWNTEKSTFSEDEGSDSEFEGEYTTRPIPGPFTDSNYYARDSRFTSLDGRIYKSEPREICRSRKFPRVDLVSLLKEPPVRLSSPSGDENRDCTSTSKSTEVSLLPEKCGALTASQNLNPNSKAPPAVLPASQETGIVASNACKPITPRNKQGNDHSKGACPPVIEAVDQEATRISGCGPVVNHYPQPERTSDIKHAITNANKAFGIPQTPDNTTSSEHLHEQSSRFLGNEQDAQHKAKIPPTICLPTLPSGEEHGEGRRSVPGWGSSNTGRNPSSDKTHLTPSRPAQQQNSLLGRGSGDREDESDPEDLPDPQDTPATHASSYADDSRRFPCVFHHPENVEADLTLECKTHQRYVSHLRVHHAGNNHRFYYCTSCFTKFDSEREKSSHDKRCKNIRCVTEGCPNFDTFDTGSCNHSGQGRKNSQQYKWIALYRLARPGEALPTPIAPATLLPSTPVNVRQLRPDRDTATGSGHALGFPPSSPTSESACRKRTHHRSNSFERQLEALASVMFHQLDAPELQGVDMVRDMYQLYMGCDISEIIANCQSQERCTAIRGLASLNQKLWGVVQRPDDFSPGYVEMLRRWARGVLPHDEIPSASPLASKSANQMTPNFNATFHAPGGFPEHNNSQPNMPPVATTTVAGPASTFPDFNYAYQGVDQATMSGAMPDFELFGADAGFEQSGFVNPGQTIAPTYQTGAARFLPFTHRDSSAALQQHGNHHGKQKTTDSGYSTTGGYEFVPRP